MKTLKHTRSICIGGLSLLAAGSLIAAALPAGAQESSATIHLLPADSFISAVNTHPVPFEARIDLVFRTT